MTMPATRSVLACASALLLVACGGDPAPADEGASASGEILPSSISDAMIPTDQLRSQPPLMDPSPGTDGAAAPGGQGEGEAAADTADGAAAAEPEAEPEPADE